MTQNDHPRNSAAMLHGPDRAAARAMLHAIGFSREDLERPIIGVGHAWIETMPCNWNHRALAEQVKAGVVVRMAVLYELLASSPTAASAPAQLGEVHV